MGIRGLNFWLFMYTRRQKKLTLRKLKLLFNCQYHRQFFIKLSNQGQFQNPQEKQILKLSLVVRFDKELTEILTVKEKASVFEVGTFFVGVCTYIQ